MPLEGQRVAMRSVTPFLSNHATWEAAAQILPTVAPHLAPEVNQSCPLHHVDDANALQRTI